MSFFFSDDAKTEIFRVPKNETITIPNNVVSIYGSSDKDYAFMTTNLFLKHVFFAKNCNLKKILPYAFYNCSIMEEIDLANCTKLESIGEGAFSTCKAAKYISLPNNTLKSIGSRAFQTCVEIDTIYVPPTVSEVCGYAFSKCYKLRECIFDNNTVLTKLPMYVFYYDPKLEYFYVPKTITSFTNIFDGDCESLKRIIVDPDNLNFISIDGIVFTDGGKTLYLIPPGRGGTYVVPENVVKIGYCSACSTRITNITLPSKLNEIDASAFSSSIFKKIDLPESLKILGSSAFSNCALEEVVFPKNITTIRSSVFSGCKNLSRVVMPDYYETMGGGIFSGCSDDLEIIKSNISEFNIKDQKLVYSKNDETIIMYLGNFENITIHSYVKSVSANVFYEKKSLKRLIFEENSIIESFGQNSFSSTCLEEIVFPDSVKSLNYASFDYIKTLKSVVLGKSITMIGLNAFLFCSNLENVTIKGGNYTILGSAFGYNFKLKNIDFGGGPKEIKEGAFGYCRDLAELKIPKAIAKIETRAFHGSGLVNVEFEEDALLDDMPNQLFDDCPHLKKVIIPRNVRHFGTYCFNYALFPSFTIPPLLETIDSFCFNECKELVDFVIPNGSKLNKIGYRAFSGCYKFEKITLESDEFCLINSALFNKNATKLIVVPPNTPVKYFAFPQTLKVVSQSAMLHCINIKQIFISSDSVVENENNAFEDCFNLESINIPKSIEKVGRETFLNCKQLQCDLLIENREDVFLQNLVEKALLPDKCLRSCERVCSAEKKRNNPIAKALFVLLIL